MTQKTKSNDQIISALVGASPFFIPDYSLANNIKGGEGLGNHDHKGRKGKRGGSADDGIPNDKAPDDDLVGQMAGGGESGSSLSGARQKLATIEDEIRHKSEEEMYIVSPDTGETMLHIKGDEANVLLSDEDNAKFKGNIVTHNHPNNSGFSLRDIHMALKHGPAEIRAVGSKRGFSMTFPDGIEKDPFTAYSLRRQYDEINKVVYKDLSTKIKKKKMTLEQAQEAHDSMIWNKWMKDHGEKLGITYTEEKYESNLVKAMAGEAS